MRVVDAIAGELTRAGVRRIYGIPGGGSNMALVGAAAVHGIEFVLMHHEPAAIFAAAGEAELSGQPAVCLATLGPGIANSVNGLAHCLLDRVPVVLITDSPGDNQYLHQRLSHASVVGGVVKRSQQILPETAVTALRAAFDVARQQPCGPVHLDLSSHVAGAEIGGAALAEAESAPSPVQRDEGSVEQAAAVLLGSRRPVVVAGLGATAPEVVEPLRALVERLRAPVLTTYKGKGVVPEHDPQAAGLVTNGALEGQVLDAADAVLAVGLDQVELMPTRWRWTHPVVSVGGSAEADAQVPAAVTLPGDVGRHLHDLIAVLPDGWRTEWHPTSLPRAWPSKAEVTRRNGGGAAPADVVAVARSSAPAGTIATVDAGSHMFAATLFWQADEPRRFLISNGLATMGYGFPAAIGAALASSGDRVVCFSGDGGLAMATGELETAARLRLPITVVVFNDSMLNLIKVKQEKRGETTDGLDFHPIDWVAVATGMGVAAERASDAAEFEAAFLRAITADGPYLLDVTVDPASYGRMLDVIRG